MNLRLKFAAASLAATVIGATAITWQAFAAVPAADASPMPTLAPMVKRVSPSVVNIATRGTIKEQPGRNPLLDDPFFRRFFDTPQDSKPRERQFQSAGSGVIVDAKNGYSITNHHVVENASEITITLLDNRTFSAKVIGSDEGADVAVLQAKQPNLPPCRSVIRPSSRSATTWSPSATHSDCSTQSPPASSALWGAAASIRNPTDMRTSSKPTLRSTPGTPAAPW